MYGKCNWFRDIGMYVPLLPTILIKFDHLIVKLWSSVLVPCHCRRCLQLLQRYIIVVLHLSLSQTFAKKIWNPGYSMNHFQEDAIINCIPSYLQWIKNPTCMWDSVCSQLILKYIWGSQSNYFQWFFPINCNLQPLYTYVWLLLL